jgi:hypothetical protein
MRVLILSLVVGGLTAAAGCSREASVACAADPRYATARSAQPVQIPDDLSPPNETDAIRLPPDTGAVASFEAGECIEEPPPFFGDSRPFVTDAEPDRKSRREARREAKREARAEAPAEQGGSPAEPAPSSPAPSGDDRVIDN